MPAILSEGGKIYLAIQCRFLCSFPLGTSIHIIVMPIPPGVMAYLSQRGKLIELTQKQSLSVVIEPFFIPLLTAQPFCEPGCQSAAVARKLDQVGAIDLQGIPVPSPVKGHLFRVGEVGDGNFNVQPLIIRHDDGQIRTFPAVATLRPYPSGPNHAGWNQWVGKAGNRHRRYPKRDMMGQDSLG